jgi:DNA-binding MarR family transcriptional regulator
MRPRALTPEAASVLRKFRVIFNSVRRHFREIEQKAGVSGAHLWTLGVVADQPGIGVNDLAKALEVHQSTVSNLLKTLAAKKLVVAQRSEEDRRAVHLFVTAAGRKVLAKAPGPYSGVLPDALGELQPQVVKRLDRDLGTLVQVLNPEDADEFLLMGRRRR